MITITQDFSKPALKNPSLVEDGFLFDLEYIEKITIVTPASETTEINEDVEDHIQTSATIYNEGTISAFTSEPNAQIIFESLDESIATIDPAGVVSRVGDGSVKIKVTAGNYTKLIEVDVSEVLAQSTYISSEFIDGSLGKHAADNLDGLLVGKTKAANGNIFSSQDHINRVFVRNTDVWTGGTDLTCISPSNSGSQPNWRAGTLVTPRHIALSAHFDYGVGTKVYFVDNNNNTIERTVTAKVRHPDYVYPRPDLSIAVLDADLPPEISFCKVCPTNILSYLVHSDRGKAPCLATDQEERALVTDLFRISSELLSCSTPVDAKRLEFFESIVIYDSGNPCFLLLDLGSGIELVLMTMWTYGGAGAGSSICNYIADLNQMIVDADTAAGISTGYTLTEADLSAFPTY